MSSSVVDVGVVNCVVVDAVVDLVVGGLFVVVTDLVLTGAVVVEDAFVVIGADLIVVAIGRVVDDGRGVGFSVGSIAGSVGRAGSIGSVAAVGAGAVGVTTNPGTICTVAGGKTSGTRSCVLPGPSAADTESGGPVPVASAAVAGLEVSEFRLGVLLGVPEVASEPSFDPGIGRPVPSETPGPFPGVVVNWPGDATEPSDAIESGGLAPAAVPTFSPPSDPVTGRADDVADAESEFVSDAPSSGDDRVSCSPATTTRSVRSATSSRWTRCAMVNPTTPAAAPEATT